MDRQILTLGHSPDSDDAFMFYALAKGMVDTGGLKFEHILKDIQTLNEWSLEGQARYNGHQLLCLHENL